MLRLVVAACLVTPALAVADPIALGDLTVERPQLREAPEGAPVAAGYLRIANGGAQDDRLISARSDAADSIEFHEMTMDEGVMAMRELPDGLVVPAGYAVSLEPGGYHLMLMGPEAMTAGDAREITLEFEHAGEVTVSFPVEGLGAIREAVAADGGGG